MSDAFPLLIPSLAPFPAPLITYYPSPLLPLPLAISKVEKTHLKKNALWMDRLIDGWTHQQTNQWTDVPMDRPTNRWTNRPIDRPTDGQTRIDPDRV